MCEMSLEDIDLHNFTQKFRKEKRSFDKRSKKSKSIHIILVASGIPKIFERMKSNR